MVTSINPVNMNMAADIEFQCRSFQSINVIFFKPINLLMKTHSTYFRYKFQWLLDFALIAFCSLFFSLPGTYGLQRFAEQPKYTEVNPGEDALLTCKIIDKRGSCSWQKDNKVS